MLFTAPIAAINLDDLIAYDTAVDKFSSELPFDVSKTPNHKRLLHLTVKRLAADKERKSQEGRLDPKIIGPSNIQIDALMNDDWRNTYEKATKMLSVLIQRVSNLRDEDRNIVALKMKSVEIEVNRVPDSDSSETEHNLEERTRFKLTRLARQRPRLDLTNITSMIMSTSSHNDMLP